MHTSLDSALGRQRRLNQVGESITQIAPDPAAAYSLRSLTGSDPKVVRVRRGSDNHEQDFTASEVSAGALTSFVNAQVVAPLDIQALEADGRTGDFLIAKAAYSLRSLGTRQATLAATGDTVARADGKFVAQVRRNVNGDVKSFTADEVTDGTLTSFVNESFTSSLPLDVAGSAAAAYGLRNLSSSYSGNVVEVRRSSDDTTQNFKAAEITDGTLLAFVTDAQVGWNVQPTFSNDSGTGSVTSQSSTATTATVSFTGDADLLRETSKPNHVLASSGDQVTFNMSVSGLDSAMNLRLRTSGTNTTVGTASVDNGDNQDITISLTGGAGYIAITAESAGGATITFNSIKVLPKTGFVKTWYDQSGNSNNATQATAANQPKIVSAGSLLNKLDFDGTANRLDVDFGSNLSQPNSIVMVHQSSRVDAKNDFFDELGTTGQRTLLDQSGSNYRMFAGSSADSGLSIDTNKNLITAIYNGASSILAKNGTASSAINAGTQGISSTSAIGFSEGTTAYYQGSMQEFIIYNSDQSDKRRAIEESIATANGITLGSFSRDGFVKTWYDQSVTNEAGDTATGNHATQATAASQPKIVSAGSLNADGGLLFDGSDDFFDTGSSLNLGTEFFITNVLNINAPVDANGSILGDAPRADRLFINSSNDKLSIRNGSVNITSSLVASRTQDNLSTYQASSSSFTFVLDGTTDAKSALSTGQSFRYIGGGTGFELSANMKELIVYDSDQSDNRTAIEANIGEVYSIDLPSGVDPGFDQVDGFVETWYDQSGNDADATQATAAEQPKIVDAGVLVTRTINGRASPSIEFSPNKLMNHGLTSLSADGQQSLFCVIDNQISTGAGSRFIEILSTSTSSGGLQRRPLLFYFNGNMFFSVGTTAGQSRNSSQSNFVSLYTSITEDSSGGTNTSHQNGTSFGSNSVTLDTNSSINSSKKLGQVASDANGNLYFTEMIYYPSDQSANRPALETNIASEYGITLS